MAVIAMTAAVGAVPAHAAEDPDEAWPITETDDAPQNNTEAEQADAAAGEPDPDPEENPSGAQRAASREPGCGSATVAAVTTSGTVTKWTAAQSPDASFSAARTATTHSTLASAKTMALDDDNALFAVGSDGTLRRYASSDSGYSSAATVGTGFSSTTRVLSAGSGILYTIESDGTLRWYRYGSEDWLWDDKGRVVGSGWHNFKTVFSGGDGILYGVTKAGDLMWYRHGDPGLGEAVWEGPEKVGTGWDDFTQISGVGEGVIYALLPDGTLKYYQHAGYEDGANSWSVGRGTVVATGLSSHTRLTTTPRACFAAAKAPRPPKRSNSNKRPLYLVHGFGLTWSGSIDCKDYWGTTVQRLKDKGWKGPILTVGFYKGDRNCNLYASGKKSNWDLDTDIEEIAQGLAWLINRNNPSNSIDVIGHSMGGLVVRYAIQGVAQGYSNFPSFINVEDAVTMATPNQGLPVCPFDFWNQCRQMQRGSPFMQKLKPNPQASTKTDWTAIGHSDDQIVSWESSTGAKKGRSGYLGPGHFVYFYSRNYPRASAHQRLLGGESRNSFRALHWDYHHKRLSANRDSVGTERVYVDGTPWDNSRRYNRAPDPIDWAYNAAWSWDTW